MLGQFLEEMNQYMMKEKQKFCRPSSVITLKRGSR